MAKFQGRRALNIDVPTDLYNMYAKLCVDLGVTKTEGIIQYLKFLGVQDRRRKRIMLDGKSKSDFGINVDVGEPE